MEETGGTFVKKSGLVMVREGEWIGAGPGSAAILSGTTTGGDVHLHFPIEVVAIGDVPDETKQEIEARIWTALHEALA